MQNQITEFTANNKFVYQQLYERLQDIINLSETDFSNLVEIQNKLPESSLENHDKKQLVSILDSIQMRVKMYDGEVDKVNSSITDFEASTNRFLSSLQNVKGSILLLKNSLSQSSVDQINTLKSGYGTVREAVIKLTEMINQIKRYAGIDFSDFENVREMVNSIFNQHKSGLEQRISNLERRLEGNDVTDLVIKKVNPMENTIRQHKEEFNNCNIKLENTIKIMSAQIKEQSEMIEKLLADHFKQKQEIKKISESVDNEISELRNNVSDKVKNVESYISNQPTIKRFFT